MIVRKNIKHTSETYAENLASRPKLMSFVWCCRATKYSRVVRATSHKSCYPQKGPKYFPQKLHYILWHTSRKITIRNDSAKKHGLKPSTRVQSLLVAWYILLRRVVKATSHESCYPQKGLKLFDCVLYFLQNRKSPNLLVCIPCGCREYIWLPMSILRRGEILTGDE